jgi:DNA-binding transcriptional LysR family regulator
MKALAIAGSGIALLPKNIVQTEIKNKELFQQKLPLTFTRKLGIFIKLDAGEQIEKLAQEISKRLAK